MYLDGTGGAGWLVAAGLDKPSWTLEQRVDNLLRFNVRWPASSQAVTYSFSTQFTTPGQTELTAAQKASVRLAFELWGDVSGLKFAEAASGGQIKVVNDNSIPYAGLGGGAPNVGVGSVVLNASFGLSMDAPIVGAYSFLVVAHEVGHAIGLPHPGEYRQGDGSPLTYEANAEYAQDTMQYSIMSYFRDDPARGTNFQGSTVQTPMLDDVAALQRLYGLSTTTRLGDTTYGFNCTADRSVFNFALNAKPVLCIVDSGGVDTIDLSGFAGGQLLNLRAGQFSNVGGLLGNVSIAPGTVIERGIGGGGGDTLVGGDIVGNLAGRAGNDSIVGGAAVNYLRGDEGDDRIAGGSLFDDINGNMGHDTAAGGLGDDWVVGGKDNDSLSGDAGDDLVYGNLGSDTCEGGDGNDIVRGGQGDDVVRAGAGADFVSGDLGNDTLTGGAGADTFNTFAESGLDRVTDFSVAEGDRVLLAPGTQYTLAQVGADTVISMAGGGQMVLVGVQMGSLTPGWIFGA